MKFSKLSWWSVLLLFAFASVVFVQAQEDTTPPVLVGFGITPQQVDTSSTFVDLTFLFHATDDISGADDMIGTVTSPSGRISFSINSAHTPPISGTNLDGTFQAFLRLPAHSEAGVWTVTFLNIYDKDFNDIAWCKPARGS